MPARRAAALLLTAAVLVVASALAAERAAPRVVLVGPFEGHATVARVRDELRLLGFEVRVLPPGAATDLQALARQHQADAAARVEEWPPEIVVWVDQAASGAPADVDPEIQVSDSLTEPAEPELLALRAVELLRGKLLPVPASSSPLQANAATGSEDAGMSAGTATGKLAGPAGADRPSDPWSDGEDRRGGLLVGPGLTLSPGGVPVTPNIRIGGSYRAVWRLGIEALVIVPLTAGEVSAAEGAIELRTLNLGAAATLQLSPPDADFRALVGLGMGAAALIFEGTAEPPYSAAEGTEWTASPFAELAGSYAFHPMVAARLDVVGALLRPEPVLRVAGREVASFGQPAVFTSLGVEVRP
jgi:hypothetical protein